MKIADAKKAGELIGKYNETADKLKSVRTKSVILAFGDEEAPRRDWLAFTLAETVADELRERTINSLILEMEKLKEQLVALGVEL